MPTKKVNPFYHFLAKVVEPDLTDHIAYLKAENEVLRSMLPKRIYVSEPDKRKLVKAGAHLGCKIVSVRYWFRKL